MSIGSRREARERALSLLYEAEAKDVAGETVLADLPLEAEPFVAELVRGVGQHLVRIDELVERFAIDWDVERMPAIDRHVLRLAIYELLERPDVPVGAVISEAVELAKRYSTDDSGRFVNGVLASVAGHVRPD
ncbi:MAG: transcription antitermination factor NusB [Actinomycetota bacterium]|nr:transcription antitermination factor NusB [Actinomycetota bacterium]